MGATPPDSMPSKPRPTASAKPGAITGPQADPAFRPLAAPEVRHRAMLAHVTHHLREGLDALIGRPMGAALLQVWHRNWPGAATVERLGLPRHNLERLLGRPALTLHLNPRELVQFAEHDPDRRKKRPSSLAFIWEGDWDLRRSDLRRDYWLGHMRDLDENRHHLERTRKYQELMDRAAAGRPWQSHREGLYLDSHERILAFLQLYLDFMDNMARHGYDENRAKDPLGVVISREGRVLKINRGLHRLGMAQWLGLPSIPVQVQHVHRLWWLQITEGRRGPDALERMCAALRECVPEQAHGPLSAGEPFVPDADFWPAPQHEQAS